MQGPLQKTTRTVLSASGELIGVMNINNPVHPAGASSVVGRLDADGIWNRVLSLEGQTWVIRLSVAT
jgi:hypothetical protein